MSDLSIEIGQRIRTYRIRLKLSQEELAEKCGLHPTYIGQVERGEKNATIESINKIATGLSISLETLFENITSFDDGNSYPAQAYDLILSATPENQKRLVEILHSILEIIQ